MSKIIYKLPQGTTQPAHLALFFMPMRDYNKVYRNSTSIKCIVE